MSASHHRKVFYRHSESDRDKWRSDILLQLLTSDSLDLSLIYLRAARLQWPLDQPHRVIAWRLCDIASLFSSPHDACPEAQTYPEAQLHGAHQQLQQQLQKRMPDALPPVTLGDLWLTVLPANSPLLQQRHHGLAAFRQAVNADIAPLTLHGGISGPVSTASHYRRGLNEARQALNAAAAMRPETGLCDYTEPGVLQLLNAVSDPALLTRFMHNILDNLMENSRKSPYLLIETLDAVLQENSNLLKAAERLDIHRNTLHQRLQRIEQLSGSSLNDPLFRLSATVALLIWRLSGSPTQETAIPLFNILPQEQESL
ncbi:PucR family transcriptional regulator [Dickeya poaceiphila]|uniref:Polyketide synthase regulator n=1 Tax=Dickeya poaceiphila TaxID=568768 RepID=A0A5B8I0Z1_9GAMM|nr:helix-turn-helix domain-containing protein [Dickeya poaceiphila]QDX29032.1 polyketide synthase regulator [Dickeya poaceiphila]